MPWSVAAAAIGAYGANQAAKKNKEAAQASGGGGGGQAAYVPIDLPKQDQNFLDNNKKYQEMVDYQYAGLSPYNEALFKGQFDNPYSNIAQANANQAGQTLERTGHIANDAANRAWQGTGHAFNTQERARQIYESQLPKVQQSSTNLYNMADQNDAEYRQLMQYQHDQLPDIMNSQRNLYGGGNTILETSMDPRGVLKNRMQHDLTEQQRAAQYARGIQSTPYGAALENEANNKFEMDWQNEQLARQAQGLQSAQSAYGNSQGMGMNYTNTFRDLLGSRAQTYLNTTSGAQGQMSDYLDTGNRSAAANTQNVGQSVQNAMGFAQGSANAAYQAGQMPYGAYQQVYGNQLGALQGYQNVNSNYLQGLNQLQSNALGYMNQGQGAQNQAFQQNAYNQSQRQQAIGSVAGLVGNVIQNTNWGNVGNNISSWWNGNSGGGSGNDPALMAWANNQGGSADTGW